MEIFKKILNQNPLSFAQESYLSPIQLIDVGSQGLDLSPLKYFPKITNVLTFDATETGLRRYKGVNRAEAVQKALFNKESKGIPFLKVPSRSPPFLSPTLTL